ncbi:MAG TPA: WS/DGAT domain-containing protein [Nakamurella sp.]|nr:WS/DGAT domain-containing protein [Nakamurella sp.]
MSVQDALWLTMDRPNNLMIIDGVLIMATNPGYDAVLDVARTRITGRFPVYHRKPVRSGGGWAWMDDPAFDLTRHVKRVRLPRPCNILALQRFMSEQRAKSLPRTRPLWVMFLVEGVHLEDGTVGSAVVIRTHHAIADGVRLTQVMLSMCDSDHAAVEAVVSRRGGVESPSWVPIPLPAPVSSGIETVIESALDSAADSIRTVGGELRDVMNAAGSTALGLAGTVAGVAGRAVSDPVGTTAELPAALAAARDAALEAVRSGASTVHDGLQSVAHPGRLANAVRLLGSKDNRVVNAVASVTKLVLSDSPDTVWSGELGVSKTIAWSAPMSLADVKAISRSQDATVNDVLLAAMAGGVRRYLDLHGAPVGEIQWLVPVNLKPFADNLPAELGNYFSLVMLPMPLDEPDARDRIRQMKAQMARIKYSDEAVITFTLQRFMSMSPGQVQFHLTNFFANKTVGVLTNVPGPQGLLRFGGSPVVQIIGFAPCSGSNPMAATIFSYNGTVTIGFATDTGLLPDPEVLVGFVMQEAAAMQSLVPQAQRRAPKAVAAGTSKPRATRRRPTPKIS